ncbi:PQQ-binding-like beta-propeller repeat protein [Streptomyces sp. NPDC020799]|uniref:outer membrane protein assembly factor BamB family protein n=1 Tax=Streptomyces sp. NPDC020799 TaxID=3365091 RepID=UPI0037B9C95D
MPPNQPPEGGFGAPRDPAANAPQTPQQPPTTPAGPPAPATPPASLAKSAATPDQPPAPPAQPPAAPPQAWGAPHAPGQPGQAGGVPPYPPNPYAQQPGAQQPNPYGAFPPPPAQPFGVPGPQPSGGPDKKRTALIIGSALAVLVAAAGGVWALTGDDKGSDKPSAHGSAAPAKGGKDGGDEGTAGPRDGGENDPNDARQAGEAKILIDQKGPDVDRAGADVPGIWVIGDHVVKTVQDKVVAYSTDDGKEKWSVPLPKRVCAAPKDTTDDGKVVVAYEGDKKDECGNYAMLDLKAGKKVWDKPIPKSGGFAESFIGLDMAISGDAVGAAWFGGSGMIRVSDGETISTPDIQAGCGIDGYAGGKALLRSWSCVSDDTSHVEKVDPATGKATWTWDGRKGLRTKKIYSTEPAVVSVLSDDKKTGGVIALKDGKERSVIDFAGQAYAPTCGMSIVNHDLGGCQGVAVTDSTLYLPTEGNYSSGNEIHAFDLDSGKRKWAAKNTSKRELLPLKADGDKVIAYQRASYDKAGAVVSVGSDGAPKVLLQIPASMTSTENAFFDARYLYDNDRFYIATKRLSGSKSGDGNRILLAFRK